MTWRLWCALGGVPCGLIAVLAIVSEPPFWLLQVGAGVGGLCVLGAAELLARRHDDDPGRGTHMGVGSSVAWAGWPAIGAVLLGLAPGALALAAALLVLVALSLVWSSRRRGPSGGIVRLVWTGAAALAIGTLAVGFASGLLAVVGSSEIERTESTRHAVLDQDARVATQALPECNPRVGTRRVLLGRGAHPRWTRDGRHLWFDAEHEGRRQIHRYAFADETVRCWTCSEEGNNRRPALDDADRSVVFDTDRFATWRHPSNTELHLVSAGGERPPAPSRRLTFSPARDDHAIVAPGWGSLLWSRGLGGRFHVVSAGLRSGHGALMLAEPNPIRAGGLYWVAPMAWSPDARHLVMASGHPLEPLAPVVLDPATDAERPVRVRVTDAASVSFSADGGVWALSGSDGGLVSGLVPSALGFGLAPLQASLDGDGAVGIGTELYWGRVDRDLESVVLEDDASWGWPTGVALSPDGRSLVLGQRRRGEAGSEERLLEIRLACEP